MSTLPLNTSYKYHLLISLIISLWLVLFLILIAPFDIAELTFSARLEILPTYGLISFLAYTILIPIQNWIFKRFKTWTIGTECIFIVLFNIIQIFICYGYYKSSIVNGNYDFQKFGLEIYLPIFFILLPIIIFLRWFLNKKVPNQTHKKLILRGDNKHDVIQLLPEELICISSADNYIEINYAKHGELHKKLLRNTLKSVQNDINGLLKVHRSHLINPSHFIEWKGNNTIILTLMEVPVSKRYRDAILEMNQSSLKTNTLSQSQ
ncbi:LytTR family DNA-binding domain-containing protein [uncultured Psychroserpens sp.]|uniref:LytTR family DNA-binding domain-containing protein n=1 Tax=uncultured Psychroserpens sp. TaxID=255436 RepID=UPI002602BC2A|nr:LytTR family DNA-binding domain-containing protein [uncultured Psychroserpens sp.]